METQSTVTESRPVTAGALEGIPGKGAWENFLGNGNILWLDCGSSYPDGYTGQNLTANLKWVHLLY